MRKLWLMLLLAGSCLAAVSKTEILWDQYGVPHIFAADRESMFYAHGWAQMHNQANLLLRLYGESRGRGAEYWGASHLPLDRWLQTNGMPERAKEWYDAQNPVFRSYMDAFARGVRVAARRRDRAAGRPDPQRRREIVALLKTGSAYYAPSAAAARMARAVAEDSGQIMPVCAWVDGEYGINGVYLGVEAEIGATGVRRVVERDLSRRRTGRGCAPPPRPSAPSKPTWPASSS